GIYICKSMLLTMLCKLKVPFLLATSIFTIVLLLILTSTPNQQAFSQTPGGLVSPPQSQLESVKILNLMPFQSVALNKELVISGESSDTTVKDCSVYVLVNGVQPYQNAIASGTGGATDFSQWKFVLTEQYTHLNEGNNKITAKLVCTLAPTRWYSVVVNGLPSSNISQTVPIDTTQQSNVSEAPIDTTQQSKLLVAILPLKNPVARGDSQNATIIVTNSHNRPIANAQIDGKLIYPGDNFEKEFKGITDLDGKFVYSWTVGKKGDIGPLVMEVKASSQGYPPASANTSIELVKSGESSQIENPFQSLQRP
ncbi:MAG TPA: hypothetical protein VL854_04235, partial [Nitrososphaeraceae archaeon]|nr:hypothetical protein [Nitrososphaeraceae archaeon]